MSEDSTARSPSEAIEERRQPGKLNKEDSGVRRPPDYVDVVERVRHGVIVDLDSNSTPAGSATNSSSAGAPAHRTSDNE
jgi:hypothetical protein